VRDSILGAQLHGEVAMSLQTTAAGNSSEPPKRAWIYLATAAIVLSIFATAIVLGNVITGVPRQSDEDGWAHLFQLAIAAQLPLFLLFVALADWTQRRRALLLLAGQIVAAALALGALAWSGY
jgi:cytochrome bd-type quinol oxidase subunit 2